MIYTTYFANIKNLPSNVIPVSIAGKAPIGYAGAEYKKLAPKWSFFSVWKETQDNDYYIKHFNEEVLNKLSISRLRTGLQMLLPYEIKEQMKTEFWNNEEFHLALVCYEKPGAFCHRHLVADWLTQHGFPCLEWTEANKK